MEEEHKPYFTINRGIRVTTEQDHQKIKDLEEYNKTLLHSLKEKKNKHTQLANQPKRSRSEQLTMRNSWKDIDNLNREISINSVQLAELKYQNRS